MERLTRALSGKHNTNKFKNKEIVIQEDFNKNLNEWKMPAYSASKIYKQTGSFINKTPINILKNFTDPYFYPKDFLYYQAILVYTGSVQFDSTVRTGGEWAFSKAFIIKVLTPEQWEGDLYRFKEILPDSRNPHRNKSYFNYFDYIKAWDFAFCYDIYVLR